MVNVCEWLLGIAFLDGSELSFSDFREADLKDKCLCVVPDRGGATLTSALLYTLNSV